MSLLQEMEKFGLADCEFNRQLIHNERRLNRLMSIYLPVFKDHYAELEHLTETEAQSHTLFLYWLNEWSDMDRRGELFSLILSFNPRLKKCMHININSFI